MAIKVHLAQRPEADELLGRSPLAILTGMLLDQQIPMEWAFTGPYTIAQRLAAASGDPGESSAPGDTPGGTRADARDAHRPEDVAGDLDAHEIASYDPERFAALLSEKPAVHRYPGSMAKRVQQLCAFLVEHYDGDAAAIWRDAATGRELLKRLNELPGFGKQKAQIFLALLGKQYGVRPEGWREAAGAYGEEGSNRSVADITGPDSLARVRAYKQEQKKAAKS
ncbi:MAG: hypothetical protein JWL58_5569 [Streptosporangiaceae bacterium]|jgi:uncharacterized HhH-GPD family protein|nr:hypothetical protein [Streptosporangiaceae bacterium]